jgi:hypothetical protein
MPISESERERRRQQCLKTKPWERSTGAKTPEGKMRSSQNALRHGRYSIHDPLRVLARWEREEVEMERFKAIAQTMFDAYFGSNAKPPERWKQIFDHMQRDEFINIWRSL